MCVSSVMHEGSCVSIDGGALANSVPSPNWLTRFFFLRSLFKFQLLIGALLWLSCQLGHILLLKWKVKSHNVSWAPTLLSLSDHLSIYLNLKGIDPRIAGSIARDSHRKFGTDQNRVIDDQKLLCNLEELTEVTRRHHSIYIQSEMVTALPPLLTACDDGR